MAKSKLRELRMQKGFQLSEMAKMLELSPSTYYRYEVGTRAIPRKVAYNISKILDVDVNDIFLPNYLTVRHIK